MKNYKERIEWFAEECNDRMVLFRENPTRDVDLPTLKCGRPKWVLTPIQASELLNKLSLNRSRKQKNSSLGFRGRASYQLESPCQEDGRREFDFLHSIRKTDFAKQHLARFVFPAC